MDGKDEKQPQELPGVVDAATEPVDLAAAFRLLNQKNAEDPEGAVETPAPQEPTGGEDEGGESPAEGEQQEAPGGAEVGGGEPSVPAGDDGGSGGSSTGIDAIDFNARKQAILREIQQQAQEDARSKFAQDNVGYYNINELARKDEDTGSIRFINPDCPDERDPNHYFKSRAEALQFIDAWNKGVDSEWRRLVNGRQQELLRQRAPEVLVIDFYPTYQAMDTNTKKIFDALVDQYAIYDNNHKPIGFNVNLNQVAQQAKKIAKQFAPQQQAPAQQQPQAQKPNGPALDMQTGGGKSSDDSEPKSIGEALKMFDSKNKKGK